VLEVKREFTRAAAGTDAAESGAQHVGAQHTVVHLALWKVGGAGGGGGSTSSTGSVSSGAQLVGRVWQLRTDSPTICVRCSATDPTPTATATDTGGGGGGGGGGFFEVLLGGRRVL
jgi:hypothetical protein